MAYNYADPYQGGDPYAQQRKQATDAAQAGGAQAQDAMTRRMAAMGNLNSGAYAQGLTNINRDTQANTENAIGNINSQQAQTSAAAQEAEKSRALQAGEFGSSQAQQAQQFGQQLAQQGGQFQQQLGQQSSQFQQQLPLSVRQLDLEASQQGLDSAANQLNYNLAQQQLSRSGGLFGGGGFLGTGLGGSGGSFDGVGGSLGQLLQANPIVTTNQSIFQGAANAIGNLF